MRMVALGVGLLLLAVVGAVGYKFYQGKSAESEAMRLNNYSNPSAMSGRNLPSSAYQVNPKDSSDISLDMDLQSVDRKMANLNTDQTNADMGLNDEVPALE